MLRKKTFLFLLFLLTTFSLFADINNQAILDNLLIDELKYSYILEGKTLPSNFFSFTNQEYNLYSSMINKNYSDFIITQPVNMGINIANAAEFYLHSNKKLKTTNIPFKYQKPLALFDLRFYASSFFYSEIEFNLKRYDTYHKKDFENNIFRTNLFFIPPYIKGVNLVAAVGIDEISKAYFNFGGKNWNIFIGRAQLNQGNGFTGNLIIGDNQEYHDMININTFWKNIKYSYLCSFFAHPSSQKQSQRTPLDGLFFYQQHRIEFSVLQNSLHFALIEGMLYQSKENFVDLRVLNPSTIYHNFYIRSNSNSIIGVECDYTPIKGINIYTQWALDDLNVEGANPPRYPNSFAGLLGVNYTRKINDGLFYLSSEGVYVSPWMYIREDRKSVV